MVTAFVLSGGGSLGAVQVGMLQALAARGVEPDLLIGTSVGALNASYVAPVTGTARRRSPSSPRSGRDCGGATCSRCNPADSAPRP